MPLFDFAGSAVTRIFERFTSVVLILMLGQSRVLFAMSRDHLLPRPLAKVHPRYGTPYRITIATGVVVAVLAGFLPISVLADLVNIGTLFAFVVVALGVVILRRTRPDLPRAFRTPFVPAVPVLSVMASVWLMLHLPAATWRKSGRSGPQGGNCVEIAHLADGQVAIRNSRHPAGPALS